MKSEAKIVILVPTESEIGVFRRMMPRADVRLTGVGPYRCAAVTAAVCAERPDWIVLAGIAGCYPESGEKVGECVLVETERTADVGSFSEGAFTDKFAERYGCPYVERFSRWPLVASNSVSAAASPFVSRDGVQIENMEGAAFFRVCREFGIPFLELRSLSNRVGDPFARWEVGRATEELARSLESLLELIKQS